MVDPDAIWYDILTCRENFDFDMKAVKLNGVFWRYLWPMLDDF